MIATAGPANVLTPATKHGVNELVEAIRNLQTAARLVVEAESEPAHERLLLALVGDVFKRSEAVLAPLDLGALREEELAR